MAYTSLAGGSTAEALFAADGSLARYDLKTNQATLVGEMEPSHSRVVLAGSADGRLFAYLPQSVVYGPAAMVEIDKDTGKIVNEHNVTLENGNNAATGLAYWGGDLYLFLGTQSGTTNVHRYRVHDQTISIVTSRPATTIVAAAASTCAPAY
jgi:hypothetical protein